MGLRQFVLKADVLGVGLRGDLEMGDRFLVAVPGEICFPEPKVRVGVAGRERQGLLQGPNRLLRPTRFVVIDAEKQRRPASSRESELQRLGKGGNGFSRIVSAHCKQVPDSNRPAQKPGQSSEPPEMLSPHFGSRPSSSRPCRSGRQRF